MVGEQAVSVVGALVRQRPCLPVEVHVILSDTPLHAGRRVQCCNVPCCSSFATPAACKEAARACHSVCCTSAALHLVRVPLCLLLLALLAAVAAAAAAACPDCCCCGPALALLSLLLLLLCPAGAPCAEPVCDSCPGQEPGRDPVQADAEVQVRPAATREQYSALTRQYSN